LGPFACSSSHHLLNFLVGSGDYTNLQGSGWDQMRKQDRVVLGIVGAVKIFKFLLKNVKIFFFSGY
jgi:hypothetical protein